MHFWVETVNKKGQEAFPILKAVARVSYKLDGVQYLVLVLHILFTQRHGLKSRQHLQDTMGGDLSRSAQPRRPQAARATTMGQCWRQLWEHQEVVD